MTDTHRSDGVARELTRALTADDDHLQRLHARLSAAAQREDALDVAYRTVDSPVGTLLLAATSQGLVRIAFANENQDDVLQSLASHISPRVLHAPARLDVVAAELDEYFAGRRRAFDVPVDWQLSHGFRGAVLHQLAREVGYGATASYGELARLAGSPKAVRATGTACATNPVPIVVPCHRVLPRSGGVGRYRGGPEAKRALLDLERTA